MASEIIIRLNCTRCGAFTDFDKESDHVVRCAACGKRHSTDSLHGIFEGATYERDEAGNLLVDTP